MFEGRMVGGWKSAKRLEGERNVLIVSELNKNVKERPYQESLRGKYEESRGRDVESVENELKKFREILKDCNNYEFAMRRVGGRENWE